jgi:hypothetical protein
MYVQERAARSRRAALDGITVPFVGPFLGSLAPIPAGGAAPFRTALVGVASA